MLTGPCRLDSGIQGQQVGLAGNLFDDNNLGGDLLHGNDSLFYGFPAALRVSRGLHRDLFRLQRIIGVLADIRCHLFDRGRDLLG